MEFNMKKEAGFTTNLPYGMESYISPEMKSMAFVRIS